MTTNVWTERLEAIRTSEGMTLRAFVERVAAVQEFGYSTVLNWHHGRMPPPTYLAAVCEAFGVRAEWMLTGRGHRMAIVDRPGRMGWEPLI